MPVKLIPPETVYSRLTAIGPAKPKIRTNGDKRARTQFRCSCGNITVCNNETVRAGHTKSCGCLEIENRIKHGMHATHIYKEWQGMLTRCRQKNNKRYKKEYIDRGITVCERWKKFENFFEDMGSGKKGWSLERLNNDAGYSPQNCVWATMAQQARNKRSTRIMEIHGVKGCIVDLAKHFNIDVRTVHYRLRNGRTPQEAFTLPIDQSKSRRGWRNPIRP